MNFDSEPLMLSDPRPKKPSKLPWLDVNIPKKFQIHGQTRSGKGVVVAWVVWRLYMAGIFIAHIYSAGGFENLYYVMNKNCQARFKRKLLEIEDENERKEFAKKLHCGCHHGIPSFTMIPHYYKVDKQSVAVFNGENWSGYDEYNEAYINCQVNEYLPPQFDFNSLRKPDRLLPKIPLFKYGQFVPPTEKATSKIQEFRETFREFVKIAKSEHRILINSPQFYPHTSQGNREKYSTTAECFRSFEELAQSDLFMKITNRPRKSPWEKSNHKIAVITNEARAFAPSQRLSGDSESSVSKKAFFNFLPENRHNKSWAVWDLQSSQDLYIGSKNQSDFTIMKCSTDKLLGEEWSWFAEKIDKTILKVVEPLGFYDVERLPPRVTSWLLNKKHLCRVYDLPDNYGYIIWENGEYRLKKFTMDFPWHYKSDNDNWFSDSGIKWKIDWNMVAEKTKSDEKSEPKNTKKMKDEFYSEVGKRFTGGDSYIKIIDDLKKLSQFSWVQWDKMNPHKLSNRFKSWEKRQN